MDGATVKKDLRTGRSVWQATRRPSKATDILRRDVSTDVLVVGAGISGAMIAEALTDAGLNVLIVDRRGALLGSTTASTTWGCAGKRTRAAGRGLPAAISRGRR